MYPEDRVLVGVMPAPADLEIVQTRHWYRIPSIRAPNGIHAEYIAFYFTSHFDVSLRWGIHFYARRTGHELVRRVDLFPDQPHHIRAQETYYKIQLGTLRQKSPPIVSRRWRRITFIQTTWDRFTQAQEINDLFATDKQFVNRVYHTLKEHGILAEREVEIKRGGKTVPVDLMIPCQHGAVMATSLTPSNGMVALTGQVDQDIAAITQAIDQYGGLRMLDVPL
jgi:hypothetical protein